MTNARPFADCDNFWESEPTASISPSKFNFPIRSIVLFISLKSTFSSFELTLIFGIDCLESIVKELE